MLAINCGMQIKVVREVLNTSAGIKFLYDSVCVAAIFCSKVAKGLLML